MNFARLKVEPAQRGIFYALLARFSQRAIEPILAADEYTVRMSVGGKLLGVRTLDASEYVIIVTVKG